MEEARRFLRYVLPGLLYLLETFILLLLSVDRNILFPLIKEIPTDNVAFPITVFIASGALGFLLSIIYYALFWNILTPLRVNHRPFIKIAVEKDWLQLMNRENNTIVQPNDISGKGAWRIITGFWHENIKTSKRFESANKRIDIFTDLAHGLGAAFIGSVFAIVTWWLIHKILTNECPYNWTDFIAPFIFFVVHFVNFKNIAKHYGNISEMIVLNELRELSKEGKTPVTINIASSDLRSKCCKRVIDCVKKIIQPFQKIIEKIVKNLCGILQLFFCLFQSFLL